MTAGPDRSCRPIRPHAACAALAIILILGTPRLHAQTTNPHDPEPTNQPPAAGPASQDLELAADGLTITHSAKIRPGAYRIPDRDGDGAIIIRGDDLTVDFNGAELSGAPDETNPDTYTGIGVIVTGKNITIRNLKVRGYKIGIHALNCPGLTIEDMDISDNFRRHLRSTPEREDGADWLFPHRNDNHEWMNNYGAGLYVERSDNVTIRRVRSRRGQNGIILNRVTRAQIYDNDCSFMSGWGLALWRSTDNVIAHNAFDFCIRGYSHGVYNRGQDSAGILMFEQCSRNIIAENSATHCGDGLFAFAGREALGDAWLDEQRERLRREKQQPNVDDFIKMTDNIIEKCRRAGNNGNLIIGNDFSYAAAHGLELTFSFDNEIINNRFIGNAICGIWGGYSQDTSIQGNTFQKNGEGGYGMERGGINIEHGRGNVIRKNTFKNNRCGVFLWNDEDAHLMKTPWAVANHVGSRNNTIVNNTFDHDAIAIQLRQTINTTVVENAIKNAGTDIDADDTSDILKTPPNAEPTARPRPARLPGNTRPVGARDKLAGRQRIIMTAWGPYDYAEIAVTPAEIFGNARAIVQILGPSGTYRVSRLEGNVTATPPTGDLPGRLTIEPTEPGYQPFQISLQVADRPKPLTVRGALLRADWTVRYYAWDAEHDPRGLTPDNTGTGNAQSNEQRTQRAKTNWTQILEGPVLDEMTVPAINFNWTTGRPSPKVAPDHFATVATSTIRLPESPTGRWQIRTVSDDGVRVFIDDREVLTNWTWHGPTENVAEVTLAPGDHDFRIEHFEIDGWAALVFKLQPVQATHAPASAP